MVRRYKAALACLIALGLSAPGSSVSAAPPPGGSAAPPPTGGSDDLREGLLAPGELPAGFVPIVAATNHDGAVSIGGGNFPGCPALEPMTTERTTAAAVTYSKGAVGPYLTHAIVRFPAVADAQEAMTRLGSTISGCNAFQQQLAGIAVRFTITELHSPPGLGDQVVALRMNGDTDVGISVAADIVAIRRGGLVLWLNDTTTGSSTAGLATGLAQAAAADCAKHLRGC